MSLNDSPERYFNIIQRLNEALDQLLSFVKNKNISNIDINNSFDEFSQKNLRVITIKLLKTKKKIRSLEMK